MSIELEKKLGRTFSRGSLAQPTTTIAETDEERIPVLQERETVYRSAGSPEWLGAALGTQRRPAGSGNVLVLPQKKDLGEGAPASQLVYRKGGGHD